MIKSRHQDGNALIIVLITIMLLAALIFMFTRSAQKGTSNMSQQQAKMAAQDIAEFLNHVDSAVQKLRSRGCSENDISFAYDGDTDDPFATVNNPASAPVDKSCNVFDANGGQMIKNIDWTKYQIDQADIPDPNKPQYGYVRYTMTTTSNVGVGTSADDLMVHINFVNPDVCRAYDVGLNVDPSILDDGVAAGEDNATLVGKGTFCRFSNTTDYGQIRYVFVAH